VQKGADISAHDIQLNSEGQPSFVLDTPDGRMDIQLPLAGEHNVMNALAAAAAAWSLSIPLKTIQSGLNNATPVNKRMNMLQGLNGCRIINDSYNANPTALLAALGMLDNFSGKKIVVLGQMGELGENAAHYHAEAGKAAREHGVEQLYAFGELCQHAVSAFGANAYYYSDRAELADALKGQLDADTTVLIKGSNSTKMWEVAEALQATAKG
jgi:UDP-N-acetylmuramoyl-tripeptide--D-alanyl-D-alanine ligase